MNIKAINNQAIHNVNYNKIKKEKEVTAPEQNIVRDKSKTTTAENSDQSPKGVLRLLQEDHFKGVSDVRLRINNYDKIDKKELSNSQEPNVKGSAYGKFLDIYNELDSRKGSVPIIEIQV